MLDRSRSRIRMPREVLPEALRQASRQGLASPLATVRLETGGLIVGDHLDPIVTAMLNVIVDASLMLTVDVSYGGDTSTTTIWATPNRAVVTSSLDPELVDIHPVRVARLPEALTDVILLAPPETVGDHAVVVPTGALESARRALPNREAARLALTASGLSRDDAELVLALESPTSRRWQIDSIWTVEQGQEEATLAGFDGGPRGQWRLVAHREPEPDTTVLTPQADGDVLRALRDVLPRRWVGSALAARPAH